MKRPKPDKNGNYVIGQSPLTLVPTVFLAVFSLLVTALSAINLISGNYSSLSRALIRIIACAVIFIIAVFLLLRRQKYIITNDKVALYGKWELYFTDIDEITLHDNFFGMLELKGKTGSFTVLASDISCSLAVLAEITAERRAAADKKRKGTQK